MLHDVGCFLAIDRGASADPQVGIRFGQDRVDRRVLRQPRLHRLRRPGLPVPVQHLRRGAHAGCGVDGARHGEHIVAGDGADCAYVGVAGDRDRPPLAAVEVRRVRAEPRVEGGAADDLGPEHPHIARAEHLRGLNQARAGDLAGSPLRPMQAQVMAVYGERPDIPGRGGRERVPQIGVVEIVRHSPRQYHAVPARTVPVLDEWHEAVVGADLAQGPRVIGAHRCHAGHKDVLAAY